jgi:LysW-gamma-L-lysine carboxypeptidase
LAEDPVRLLVEVLKAYSPSTKEERVARLLQNRMNRMGYKNVRIDTAGNVIGEAGGGRTRVLLCGHMDTVPGKLRISIKDGKLTGRGATDAKSPLCAMVIAGHRLRDRRDIHITVAGVTREEGDSLGLATLIRSGKRFDYAVFGEPSGAGRITVGYRGRISAHFTIRTEGGHAGAPWAHPSALDSSLSILDFLKKYEKSHTAKGDHFRSVSISPTILRAGTYHNVVPNVARMTLDVRVPPGMTCKQVERDIKGLAGQYSKANTSAKVVVSFEEGTDPYEAQSGSTVVRAFQRAIILKLGSRPVMVNKTGTGDMNTLAIALGNDCVTYGPGEANLAHTNGEFVLVEDYLNSIEVLTEAVRQIAALSKN